MDNILPWTLSILETTPERWTQLAQSTPDELMRRPAAAGQWSALECLHHLVAIEGVFNSRLNAFVQGLAEFPAYDPDSPENQPDASVTPGQLAQEFARQRAASLPALKKLGQADLQRSSRHAHLGPVTLEQMVHEWAAHDLNHTVQAERALMQPFIQGSGPWQQYFTDHVVA